MRESHPQTSFLAHTMPMTPFSRRELLTRSSTGFGLAALNGILQAEVPQAHRSRKIAPKARSVIFCYMSGGVSHIDTFDPKPLLAKYAGKPMPVAVKKTQFNNNGTVQPSHWAYKPRGQSGIEVSEMLPQLGGLADDLCVIRSMTAKFSEHAQGNFFMHTGFPFLGNPSAGAWTSYGLGTESANLPGYVVLQSGDARTPHGGVGLFSNGFLPAQHQASIIKADEAEAVENIRPQQARDCQRRQLDFIGAMDRRFANTTLKNFGVETTYFDPMIGAGIEKLIRPNTKVVYLEAPGSQTFEVQDVDATAAVAKKHGAVVIIDNTWATPLCFRPLDHGVDLVVHALTKYQSGNSDILLGAVVARDDAHWRRVKQCAEVHGHYAHPDDCATCLRGIRSLEVRLARHASSALEVARFLESRAEVARMLHPALPSHPDHALWRRDFAGASGLFGCVLRPHPRGRAFLKDFLERLRLFGMGFSWGGFESLIVASDVRASRTAPPWTDEGALLRLQIGLEDPRDLIADLAQALDAAGG